MRDPYLYAVAWAQNSEAVREVFLPGTLYVYICIHAQDTCIYIYIHMYMYMNLHKCIYVYIYMLPPPVIYHFRPLKPYFTVAAVKS